MVYPVEEACLRHRCMIDAGGGGTSGVTGVRAPLKLEQIQYACGECGDRAAASSTIPEFMRHLTTVHGDALFARVSSDGDKPTTTETAIKMEIEDDDDDLDDLDMEEEENGDLVVGEIREADERDGGVEEDEMQTEPEPLDITAPTEEEEKVAPVDVAPHSDIEDPPEEEEPHRRDDDPIDPQTSSEVQSSQQS